MKSAYGHAIQNRYRFTHTGMPVYWSGKYERPVQDICMDRKARTGLLSTRHGDIQTPAFMPVGTAGTAEAMMPDAVAKTGADIVLAIPTFDASPGVERVARLGGLHNFMNW